jgi:hypothetical protein
MQRGICFLFAALLTGAAVFVRADPTDDAIVAAMKLSGAINYSWTTTINQNSRPLEIHGKTSADGYSLLTFVGYSAGNGALVAKSGAGDGVNTVFLGDSKYVMESNGSWVIPSDVSSAPAEASSPKAAGIGGASGTSGRRARGGSGGTGVAGQRRQSGGTDPRSSSPTVGPKLPAGVN